MYIYYFAQAKLYFCSHFLVLVYIMYLICHTVSNVFFVFQICFVCKLFYIWIKLQEGRLNIHRITGHVLRLLPHSLKGHVLRLLPHSLKGFIPSVLKPNLMFLESISKSGNSLSTFLHWDPSAGCLSIWSFLRSSLCHRINLACALFLNKRFNRCISGKYHITVP